MMLALKSAGKDKESLKTLIFDEIDSGIGGKTAEFIARKLGQLAARHQVICITHLPQIASAAAHHFGVDKRVEKDRTFTGVRKLGPEERVEEIARLIAGSRLTEASRQIAREMLDERPGERTKSMSRSDCADFLLPSGIQLFPGRRRRLRRGLSGSTRRRPCGCPRPFGGGIARRADWCGALTGAFLVIGLKHGRIRAEDAAARDKTYALVQEFIARFTSPSRRDQVQGPPRRRPRDAGGPEEGR